MEITSIDHAAMSIDQILTGHFVFNFKTRFPTPSTDPDYDSELLKVWVTKEGLIVSGKRICGYFGNTTFKVFGSRVQPTTKNVPTYICTWDSVRRLTREVKIGTRYTPIQRIYVSRIKAAIRSVARIRNLGQQVCHTDVYNYAIENGGIREVDGTLYGLEICGPHTWTDFTEIAPISEFQKLGIDYNLVYNQLNM